jgi:septal ring-binding cell division protein DamX
LLKFTITGAVTFSAPSAQVGPSEPAGADGRIVCDQPEAAREGMRTPTLESDADDSDHVSPRTSTTSPVVDLQFLSPTRLSFGSR